MVRLVCVQSAQWGPTW